MDNFERLHQLLCPYEDAAADCWRRLRRQENLMVEFYPAFVEQQADKFYFGPESRPYRTVLDLLEKIITGSTPWEIHELHSVQWVTATFDEHRLRTKVARPILWTSAVYEVEFRSASGRWSRVKNQETSWMSFLDDWKLVDLLSPEEFQFSLSFRRYTPLPEEKLMELNHLDPEVYFRELALRYELVAKQFYHDDQAQKNDRATAWLLSAGLPAPRATTFQPLNFWTEDLFVAEKLYNLFAATVVNPEWMNLELNRQLRSHAKWLEEGQPYQAHFQTSSGSQAAGFYWGYLQEPDVD